MTGCDNKSLLTTCVLVAVALFSFSGGAWPEENPAKGQAATGMNQNNGNVGGTASYGPPAYVPDEILRDRQDMGSSFVPLDSWIYPAFEKFSALGYLDTAILGSKPWTRIECARLTDEIADVLREDGSADAGLTALHSRLEDEFAYEIARLGGGRNRVASLESVYTRVVSISGPALTDSYHFGQTVSYDLGRPFQRGTNGQAGGSVRASAGPVAFFARAEFQHAPSAPPVSSAALAVMSVRDAIPVSSIPQPPGGPINRARLLEAYASFAHRNWQFVLGRQSLSWGPSPDGSMIWSNNIEPVTMVRIVNAEPLEPAGFLRFLGQVRIDQFVGQLSGHGYIPKPYIVGQKLSLKPFPFLELGFARTLMLGGAGGDPVTIGNVARGLSAIPAPNRSVPGDDHSEIDWYFRVPGLRNYIVLYGDAYADDDGLPLQNPGKNPWRPGIYLTRFPGISKLDLHFEGVSTEQVGAPNGGLRDLNYWNQTYRDGYTNNGFLIGNTVGRYGRAMRGWLTYWLSPRDTVRFDYKRSKVSAAFIPGGGSWQDYTLRNDLYFRSGLYLKSGLQVENISQFPLLFAGRQRNVTATVEFGFMPGESGRN
jgi:Capsule assembly protein Wzi